MHASTSFIRKIGRTLCLAGGAACAAGAVHAQAAPASDWALTGNGALVSNYIFRGISQTQHAPTFQVTLDATHKGGAYFGTFGSGVSNAAYANGSGSEIDVYGGYRLSLNDTQNIDAGLVTYWYPRAQYIAANGDKVTFHSQELKLGYNNGSFNITGWLSLSKYWFGFAADPAQSSSTRGSTYLEVNWSPEIASGLALNLHAGTQRIRGLRDFNFHDVKAGVTWTTGRWALAGAVTHNTGDATLNGAPVWIFFDADGRGKRVSGTRGVVSVSYSF